MTKTYQATTQQQIVDVFEMWANRAQAAVDSATTAKQKALERREATTWRCAADILRNTECVGWK